MICLIYHSAHYLIYSSIPPPPVPHSISMPVYLPAVLMYQSIHVLVFTYLLCQVLKMHYQLPSPKLVGEMENQLNNMYILIWALSTIVPPVYMGRTEKKDAAHVSACTSGPYRA